MYFQTFFKLWLRKNSFRKLILKNIQKMEFFIFQSYFEHTQIIWTFGSELLGLAKHKQRYYGAYRSFSLKWPCFLWTESLWWVIFDDSWKRWILIRVKDQNDDQTSRKSALLIKLIHHYFQKLTQFFQTRFSRFFA